MVYIRQSLRVTSLAVGQSYDCPSASEVTLKDMGKIDRWQTIGETEQSMNHMHNRPISQIPQCTCLKSHNSPVRTEMCTFLFWMMYYGIWASALWICETHSRNIQYVVIHPGFLGIYLVTFWPTGEGLTKKLIKWHNEVITYAFVVN